MKLLPFIVFTCAYCLCMQGVRGQDMLEQVFHENGRLASTRFQVGAEERFILYHENGRVKETGAYRNGVPTGRWTRSDEDGRVVLLAFFKDGHRTGTWTMRSLDGSFSYTLSFSGGRMKRGEQYDATGDLVAWREY
ncbi:MAG: hypothetical protein JNM31_13470 [Flavobacteriales bacterium]|nr:hypothetical protein [Flavobacteriales bacterium]